MIPSWVCAGLGAVQWVGAEIGRTGNAAFQSTRDCLHTSRTRGGGAWHSRMGAVHLLAHGLPELPGRHVPLVVAQLAHCLPVRPQHPLRPARVTRPAASPGQRKCRTNHAHAKFIGQATGSGHWPARCHGARAVLCLFGCLRGMCATRLGYIRASRCEDMRIRVEATLYLKHRS